VLGAAASLRIQKRVLVVKVVKTALWNYFKNRQRLITKNTYRQLAARHKFFYQQFRSYLPASAIAESSSLAFFTITTPR
jgi:hypothetical protein